MQGAQQQSLYGLYVEQQKLDRMIEFLIKIRAFLIYLITPEDTAQAADRSRSSAERQHGYDIRAGIKAVFWFAVAVLMALIIGQLK